MDIMTDLGQVSDGYHTFDELYTHRHLLLCLALMDDLNAWKSRWHEDGKMYEGWFIAGTELLIDGVMRQITYHLPLAYWDLCAAEELLVAPPWDGHTAAEVAARLRQYLVEMGG